MAIATGLTAARMLEIEAASVVDGSVDGSYHLILVKHDGTLIDAGYVRGPTGATGSYPDASETDKGILEIATSAEILAGVDNGRAVSPAGLQLLTATDLRKGIIQLATDAEVIAGTDTARAVTPAGLAALTSSSSRRGLVELATNAEVQTATDTSRAVTPAGLQAKFGQAGIPFLMAAGSVSSPGGGSNVSPVYWDAGQTVTLPVGRFTQAPIVVAATDVQTSGGVAVGISLSAITTSSFHVRINRVTAVPSGFKANWIAIQMLSGAAAG